MFPPLQLVVPGVTVLLLVIVIMARTIRPTFVAFNARKHGTKIAATVTRIDAEVVVGRGKTTSYVLHADWEDPRTHKLYHFKRRASSVHLPLNHHPGSLVDVLIDPKNPRRYEVVFEAD